MDHPYTEDDLLLYNYGELPQKEAIELEKAIQSDENLYKAYHRMLQVTGRLDLFSAQPHPSSVEIILEHSDHLEHSH